MGRTVLIDADILAYQIAVGQEDVFEFNGQYTISADLNKGIVEVENAIAYIIDHVDADGAALFVTPDGGPNFRKDILATYKGNRSGRKPMLVEPLKAWMRENTRCFMEDVLEADDLIGIHATMPHKGERVIYSADKDLKTIPGLHWDADDGEVVEVTKWQADRKFYEQVLTGDAVDNYKGCPGVGLVAATAFLDAPFEWVKQTKVLKSGPNKGEERTTWVKSEMNGYENIWTGIVSHYRKAGLTKQEALIQARCARILRHGEFDFKNKKVKLWTPN